jgi:hypothetical protein
MQGWIKLHRGLIDWEWYDHLPTKVLFIHLLLKANHKDNSYRGKIVKKGHLLTSRELLSKETGLTERQIRTALNHLKSTNEIAIKSNRQGTEIKVVKYSEYQDTTNETPNERPRSDQQTPSNNNDKKEKNEKEIIQEIYKLYPSTCPVKGNSNSKGSKDKDKIKRILKNKEETVESLKAKIERYTKDCKNSNTFMKNFSSFLNNLPDYSEEEKKEAVKKENPYEFWKDQLLNDPNTIFDGTFFYMEHTRKNTLDYSQYMELARLNDDKRKRQSHAK